MVHIRIVFTAFLIVVSGSIYAQTTSEIQMAFTNSYTNENDEKYSEAAAELQKVYIADSYEINLRLGWLLYKASKYTESVKYYKKAIELLPYSEEAKLGIILPYSSLNKWDNVKEMYLKILEVHPQNTYVLYNLGLLYYNKAEYMNAFTYLKQLTDLYPFDYDGVILFAWTNYMLGKNKEAKVLFTKALYYSPNAESALEGLKLINK